MKVGNAIDFKRNVFQTHTTVKVAAYTNLIAISRYLTDVVYLLCYQAQLNCRSAAVSPPLPVQEGVERYHTDQAASRQQFFDNLI